MHRDDNRTTRGTQVQVALHSDRLIDRSPGGRYGGLLIDKLGEEGLSSSRNTALASLLTDTYLPGSTDLIAENRSSGILAMLRDGYVTNEMLRQWGVDRIAAGRVLRDLVDQGLAVKEGGRRYAQDVLDPVALERPAQADLFAYMFPSVDEVFQTRGQATAADGAPHRSPGAHTLGLTSAGATAGRHQRSARSRTG
jgi:ATP-dependent DNA helicase RecG